MAQDVSLKLVRVEGRDGDYVAQLSDLGHGMFQLRVDDQKNPEFWLCALLQIETETDH